MSSLLKRWSFLVYALLVACSATGPDLRHEVAQADETEACGEDGCVTFLCDEEACGVYRCEDVEPEPVLLAYKGGITAPAGSGPRRNWGRRQGAPGDGLPLFIIPWRIHDRRPFLPSELEALRIRDPIKHHIFPQQRILTEWFRVKGINVHRYTMVLEREVHDRIHQGAEGGPWNKAWRDFMNSNRGATEAQIWEHAVKLIARFELAGPIVPYHLRVRPAPASPTK